MDESELRNQLLLGQDRSRQFNGEPIVDTTMAAEFVAFANSGGGHIFIGVDRDGTIQGMDRHAAQCVGEDLAKIAWNSVNPPFSILTRAVASSEGIVVVVKVPDGASKPYCDSKGEYWVKNGPDKRRVQSPEELARLFQLGGKLYAESQPVASSTLEDIDHLSFIRFFEQKYGEQAPDPIRDSKEFLQILENLELIVGGRVTVAGLLLFGKRLPVLLPEMKIDAVWFKGIDRSGHEWWDQRTITGNLAEQYEASMGFVKRWLGRRQNESSFNSQGSPEIPHVVFEEILTNALVHRDYFIKDSIKLFIFDDRVEVRSPGALPNSLTIEQIRRGVRRSRNVLLASFAPDLLRYRGIGSGILRALRSWPGIEWMVNNRDEEVVATIPL